MYILGINSVFHESSACLLKDGKVLVAVEEERFNRIKRGKLVNDNADDLPLNSIRYCLGVAGIALSDIEHIGYSFDPSIKSPLTANIFIDEFYQAIAQVPGKLQDMGFKGEFHWIGHHTAHAASAFYVSPFADAAILVIDGIGEQGSTSFFSGKNNKIELLQEVLYPNSLGFLWELTSMFIGFDIYDAAKVMGLASYGNPERYAEQLQQIVHILPQGQFTTDKDILNFDKMTYCPPGGYFDGLAQVFGVPQRKPTEPITDIHHDIAAALQVVTNDIMLHSMQYLHSQVGSSNLCMAGGVALNCVSNTVAFEKSDFEQMFVQPASHDGGTALGAACYVWNHLLGQESREPMTNAYLGPEFTDAEIEHALQAQQLNYQRTDSIEQKVAQLISEGHVVSFFQGRMELGPRALGNRSLLADPRHPNMREILNQKVKHREYFRPLAPSVLHEEARHWFEIGKETSAADFMLIAYPAKPEVRSKIPSVVHVDGSSRVQTVKQAENPRYHKVISEFCKISGVPIVLNTSFNDSEPIVCTPNDAIDTFLKTEIDYLAIGNFLVNKADNRSA